MTDDTVLDDPTRSALAGAHARFADRYGAVVRYSPDVSVWAAVDGEASAADFAALARAVGRGGGVGFVNRAAPGEWGSRVLPCLQMVDSAFEDGPSDRDGVVPLGVEDVADMLDLTRRTEPGPFLPRTIELGGYVGVRIDGRLVAMGGRRLHPAGWIEISAVCTDPDFRGQGLAARVMRAVTAGIHAEGERAFLHVLTTNRGAIALYERLGFAVRREIDIVAAIPPGTPVP